MLKVMFVCHGNICRSPMAEFVFRDLLKKNRLSDKVEVFSSATSYEAIGCEVDMRTQRQLSKLNIKTKGKISVKFTKSDYDIYDYIVCMDSRNITNLLKIINDDPAKKVTKLLDYSTGGDIADPWYTGDFEKTFLQVCEGCQGLLEAIKADFRG